MKIYKIFCQNFQTTANRLGHIGAVEHRTLLSKSSLGNIGTAELRDWGTGTLSSKKFTVVGNIGTRKHRTFSSRKFTRGTYIGTGKHIQGLGNIEPGKHRTGEHRRHPVRRFTSSPKGPLVQRFTSPSDIFHLIQPKFLKHLNRLIAV